VISPSFIPEELASRWCRVISEADRPYFSGGIFPRELAVFLAACEACDVDLIVETGRQDGYSTSVLADYAERTGTTVVSIDRAADPERDAAARARLASRPVNLLDGDAESLIPDAVPDGARRIGLLIDGPKEYEANRLILAAATAFPVVVFACHGWYADRPAGRELKKWFPDLAVAELDGEEFAWFRAWEQELVAPHLSRPLERSSLALSRVQHARGRWSALLLHDRGRAVLENVRYAWRRLRGAPVFVPAAFIARDFARQRAGKRVRA
jgi:methyltransferase family protein